MAARPTFVSGIQQMKILLFPFTVLYALGISIRNACYNLRICKSTRYNFPVILIGNLSVGGTGKTPHVEMLTRFLLAEKYQVAVLSRGYGRKTKGFLEVTPDKSSAEVGDEPLQIKRKFSHVRVVVDGNRRRGIRKIRQNFPEVQIVLMDDGFQHRKIEAGLSIVLRDYNTLDKPAYLLPMGRLREPLSAAKRANHQIISKTPDFFSPMEKRIIRDEVRKSPDQEIFFTYMQNGDLHSFADAGKPSLFNLEFYEERGYQAFIFAGIAQSAHFESYIRKFFPRAETRFFSDHHPYSRKDVEELTARFHAMPGENKIVITTEKDAMRLSAPEIADVWKDIPLFFIPVDVRFHHDDRQKFQQLIRDYLKTFVSIQPGRRMV